MYRTKEHEHHTTSIGIMYVYPLHVLFCSCILANTLDYELLSVRSDSIRSGPSTDEGYAQTLSQPVTGVGLAKSVSSHPATGGQPSQKVSRFLPSHLVYVQALVHVSSDGLEFVLYVSSFFICLVIWHCLPISPPKECSSHTIYIYIYGKVYEKRDLACIIKKYNKNALRLICYNFRTVNATNFLFSILHTAPFLYGKIHFGVLHLLRVSIATFDTPLG